MGLKFKFKIRRFSPIIWFDKFLFKDRYTFHILKQCYSSSINFLSHILRSDILLLINEANIKKTPRTMMSTSGCILKIRRLL